MRLHIITTDWTGGEHRAHTAATCAHQKYLSDGEWSDYVGHRHVSDSPDIARSLGEWLIEAARNELSVAGLTFSLEIGGSMTVVSIGKAEGG